MVELGYVWEKLHRGTRALAASPEALDKRLRGAWQEIGQIQEHEMESFFQDEDERRQVRDVYAGLHEANGGASRLAPDEAQAVAGDIVSLYDSVARRVGVARQ